LVGLITSPTMDYLAMPTVHASRSLINAFVLDRMLVIKACSAGELGGFGGSGSGGGSGSSGSSSSIGGGGSDSSFDSVNVPLLRRREPLKWRDSIGGFPHSTPWFVEYYNSTGTVSHVAFCTMICGEDGTISGVGADNRDTFTLEGTWKNDAFSGSMLVSLNIHYHSNETIRYREKGNLCHLGWWCDEANIVTGASLVPGAWGAWENTSAQKHHELRHGGVFRLYPAEHRTGPRVGPAVRQFTAKFADDAEKKFVALTAD
jgi:hypothetical protein